MTDGQREYSEERRPEERACHEVGGEVDEAKLIRGAEEMADHKAAHRDPWRIDERGDPLLVPDQRQGVEGYAQNRGDEQEALGGAE